MPSLKQARLIYYIPSVLPADGCNDGIKLESPLFFGADKCDEGVDICVEIPFGAIGEYAISDNGAATRMARCQPAPLPKCGHTRPS